MFESYALGLARSEKLPARKDEALLERRRALINELVASGIKGWPEHGTFYTRTLPAGCRTCLKGEGSNLCLTTHCNRDCFFCFNPKPRVSGISVHGRKIASESDIPEVLKEFNIHSLGLSGGEPLLDPPLVLRVIKLLRARLDANLRIDLYTNGDLLTDDLLNRLREAGLDGLRINVVAGGYKLSAVRLALRQMADVEVEIPAIPQHRKRLLRLVRELEDMGAPHLILHELFASAQNLDALRARGCEAVGDGSSLDKLTWSGVLESDETALSTLLYALKTTLTLSVYYCSCATQQWISEQALKRRSV